MSVLVYRTRFNELFGPFSQTHNIGPFQCNIPRFAGMLNRVTGSLMNIPVWCIYFQMPITLSHTSYFGVYTLKKIRCTPITLESVKQHAGYYDSYSVRNNLRAGDSDIHRRPMDQQSLADLQSEPQPPMCKYLTWLQVCLSHSETNSQWQKVLPGPLVPDW